MNVDMFVLLECNAQYSIDVHLCSVVVVHGKELRLTWEHDGTKLYP